MKRGTNKKTALGKMLGKAIVSSMLAIVLLGINPAEAVTILEDPTVTDVIPEVTQFFNIR